MAKVRVEDDCIDIRVSLMERMMLAERSRKLPLSRVRGVNAHPPMLDLMVHWAAQGSTGRAGVSSYEGHMIPSTRNPKSMLSIELEDEAQVFVEVEDEATEQVAARISRAIGSEPPPARTLVPPASGAESGERLSDLALAIARVQESDDAWDDEEDERLARQRRDPLMQGIASVPPPRRHSSLPAPLLRLSGDRELIKLAGLCLTLGAIAVLTGVISLATGARLALIELGAGALCSVCGVVALAVVAHHRS